MTGSDSQQPDMKKVLHPADARGKGEHGWLSTRYSFSFASWHDPARLGFGALRVLNDDTIAPSAGFPMHGHKDMEIITIVTSGTLTHQDSLGNVGTVAAGEVQTMSAGIGIVHSEYNASSTEPLSLFQIWIQTAKVGTRPQYQQSAYENREGIVPLVGPDLIAQNAHLSRLLLSEGKTAEYQLHAAVHGVYVFVISGELAVAEEELAARDALGISNIESLSLTARSAADALLIEVPLELSA